MPTIDMSQAKCYKDLPTSAEIVSELLKDYDLPEKGTGNPEDTDNNRGSGR